MPRSSLESLGSHNMAAFLDLIAWAEGTSTSKHTKDDGYDIVVGGVSTPPGPFPKTWNDYEKGHPNILVTVNSAGLKSTAFGRYQALKRTWDEVVKRYSFRGRITPEAQDLFAVKKITERGAFYAVHSGQIAEAIRACNKEWASFTGSSYGQRTHTLEDMLAAYKRFGGIVQGG